VRIKVAAVDKCLQQSRYQPNPSHRNSDILQNFPVRHVAGAGEEKYCHHQGKKSADPRMSVRQRRDQDLHDQSQHQYFGAILAHRNLEGPSHSWISLAYSYHDPGNVGPSLLNLINL
jgi:hypothetical protein